MRRAPSIHPELQQAGNGIALPWAEVPSVLPTALRSIVVEAVSRGGRLVALCAVPSPGVEHREPPELLAVLADDARGQLGVIRAALPDNRRYPALSSDLPQAQAFERELFEEHGLLPEGHPWLKPLRRHDDLETRGKRTSGLDLGDPGRPHPFFQVDGPSIHEVAVGPVHAGIIEPGHFRFQCHGESVHHLEIQLGYQHRGAEALLLRSSPARRFVIAESIAGDTSVGHALAYCTAIEALANAEAPLHAQAIRGIALELERLSNHVGDLGALCNDVGYLPGAAWFGRLRGEFLNLLMEISGSRFGRGLLKLGGVRFGISPELRGRLLARLSTTGRELRDTAELTFGESSVCSRFEQAGVVTREMAEDLGLVGPVARASGCDRDARRDHPGGIFRFVHIPVALVESGDVMGRALVRWLEAQRSMTFLHEQLAELSQEELEEDVPGLRSTSLAVSIVEGWRGEIVHVATTSAGGQLAGYKIVDPSFHNWFGLAIAMRGNQISDFPLCNKSFNLSYAGHDL
jgi:Ni,Fe-hydrogenase III large subunit